MSIRKIIRESIEEFDWIKDEPLIDLRNAKFGDILISSHGATLMYIGGLPEEDYYDHEVVFLRIPESSTENPSGNHYDEVVNLEPLTWTEPPKSYKYRGTRVHSGHSFKKNRMPDFDHDIIEVIPREQFDVNTLNESDDLEWIKNPRKNDLDGIKLGYHPMHKENPMVVIDNGEREVIIRTHGNGDFKHDRRTVKNFIERGTWHIINESDDFDWIDDEEVYYPIEHVRDLKIGNKYYLDYRVGFENERLKIPVVFRSHPSAHASSYAFTGEGEDGELRNYLFFGRSTGEGLYDMIESGKVTYKKSDLNEETYLRKKG